MMMMKTRIVWTKIWEDEWFQSLSDPAQKLFLYLITNSRINICGCYEITDRTIIFDTRIKQLEKIKQELFPKAKFLDGWVYLPNAQGYGGYVGINNELAFKKEMALIPENISSTLFSNKGYTHQEEYIRGMDTSINHKSEIINNKYSKIEDIKEEDFLNISDQYKVPSSFVRSKYDDLINWHEKNPQKNHYKNYLSALRDWVKRDSLNIKQEYAKRSSDVSI